MDATNLSLIERVRDGSHVAWNRLDELYRPLILGTLRRYSVPDQEADDLAQDVMLVVHRRFPDFSHAGRTGSFRSWLRKITANRALEFWRRGKIHPVATGNTNFGMLLQQLEDPHSGVADQWDRDHDQHVISRLLEMILVDFQPTTQQAFRLYVLQDQSPVDVAQQLGMSVHAVYIAKSRIMRRLREEAAGLSDDFSFL